MAVPRIKTKTISRHYKRRRADERCEYLNETLVYKRTHLGRDGLHAWLKLMGYPAWTTKFEVKPARLRFHYRVVSVER